MIRVYQDAYADRALSTYLRRPAWISQPLRAAVKDNWPAGEDAA